MLINAQTSLASTAETSAQAAAEIFGGLAEIEVGIDEQVCTVRSGASSSETVAEISRELGLAKAHATLRLSRSDVDASEILIAKQLGRIVVGNAENLALLQEATESARDRQDVVAIVSHDLRTPLQSLSLGIDTIRIELEKKGPLLALGSTLDRMRRSIRTMSRLLADLLDVNCIHDGALSVQVAPADLQSILTDVREASSTRRSRSKRTSSFASRRRPPLHLLFAMRHA